MSTTYMCAHCGRTPGHVGVSFDDGWFQRHFRDCPGLIAAWLLAERTWERDLARLLAAAYQAATAVLADDELPPPPSLPWEMPPLDDDPPIETLFRSRDHTP